MPQTDRPTADPESSTHHSASSNEPNGVVVVPALPTRTAPDVRLFGSVSPSMLTEFFRQQSMVPEDKPLVFELSTSGGDADSGRRIAEELRLWQEDGREVFFLGKTHVFSAGVTIMAAVPPDHRFLTRDAELLIHERKMQKKVRLDGALRGCRTTVHNLLADAFTVTSHVVKKCRRQASFG